MDTQNSLGALVTDPQEPKDGETPEVIEKAARDTRNSVMLSAIVEGFGGGKQTKHRVRDLSAGGARIDQAGALRKGATVLVSVGALQAVAATVVWVENGLAGLQFAKPVLPDDARAKTAIAPRSASTEDVRPEGPTAGWLPDLNNPYRKR
ncbi:PilZ domain-containing protein [Sphingomonas sp. BAUL-RG-20F-R05-02]|uniref:PilZ domain-containing protein n=1 Tax=Sphingomonas sp. BAUL-RG-20F-R05-02 TaxID=2914830 RepID=UPI001F594FCF|nr:PilZ domain-containing protein [Sphingomonas sp. BAUL-RG-20F-R05-02]